MSMLLEKAVSPEVMADAWQRFKNDKAIWAPGMPRVDMEKQLAYHLLTLASELRSGTYRPDPVRSFVVQKGDGCTRKIVAFTLRDKIAQRAVLTVLEPLGERIFHPGSYAYRQGRNTAMAVERIAEFARSGLPWAVSADILNCFDTIPRQPLLAGVKKSVTADGKVLQLIQRWIETTAVPKTRARHTGIGIPQGAVLSPFLCNVYLTAFDNSLAAKRIRFVRFADNVFALAGSREGAAEIRKRLAQELHRLGMELNQAKTKIVRYGPEVQFLGRPLPHLGRRERACIRENRW